MKAVISIVGKFTDDFSKSNETNPNYGHLRWEDIKELLSDGCIEFQNHTYNLHSISQNRKGCRIKYNESIQNYTNILTNDLVTLQTKFKNHCNYTPNTFTYPYGAICKESLNIVKSLGFKSSLSCTSGINLITKDPECLYLLKRNNRIGNISTEAFFNSLLNK